MTKPIVKVHVAHMIEAVKGPSWWVTLTNNAGQTLTPFMTRNRDHALIDAQDWADFLGLALTPYEEDGAVVEPDAHFRRYNREED